MLSKRALKALEILGAGGYFREALETQFRGGEKFEVRLRSAGGAKVKGFGWKCRKELLDAGLLRWRECPRGSTFPTEHVLIEAPHA